MDAFPEMVRIRDTVAAEAVHGGMVVLDLEKNRYFGLYGAGARVWECLREHGRPEAALAALLEEFDVAQDVGQVFPASGRKIIQQAYGVPVALSSPAALAEKPQLGVSGVPFKYRITGFSASCLRIFSSVFMCIQPLVRSESVTSSNHRAISSRLRKAGKYQWLACLSGTVRV